MLYVIIAILFVSLVLYILLGGADFGAGIVETFAGRKGENTVSKALAPVWEANHIWLILAVVIMFTGFPIVYSTISLSLHIPLMIVLLGIVLRGSSFIFRYYDITDHPTHKYFTLFFKIASFIAPVFLGVIFGAMVLGNISLHNSGSFYERFIMPWCNLFCFMFGLFLAALFAYIAATFLTGETSNVFDRKKYVRLSKIFLVTALISGVLIFITAEFQNKHLLAEFLQSAISIIAFGLAILLIPLIIFLFSHPDIFYIRAITGFQITLIVAGWFAIQFPVMLYEKNGDHLSFFNAHAPDATLYQLLIALLVGLVLIIPAFYFLFKVFKKTTALQE